MPNYIVLMSRTATDTSLDLGPNPDAQEQLIRDGLVKAGGELVKLYWTLGRYDLIAEVRIDRSLLAAGDDIGTASDADIANGFAYWLGTTAGVHTETLPALDPNSAFNALVVAARCGGAAPGSTPAIRPEG